MTQQYINVGEEPNDNQGDTLRDSFIKTNENFTDLYGRVDGVNFLNVITLDSETYGITLIGRLSDNRAYYRHIGWGPLDFRVSADENWVYPDSPMPVGGIIMVGQFGDGQVSILPDLGVQINTTTGWYIDKQNGTATLTKVGHNMWDLRGDLWMPF